MDDDDDDWLFNDPSVLLQIEKLESAPKPVRPNSLKPKVVERKSVMSASTRAWESTFPSPLKKARSPMKQLSKRSSPLKQSNKQQHPVADPKKKRQLTFDSFYSSDSNSTARTSNASSSAIVSSHNAPIHEVIDLSKSDDHEDEQPPSPKRKSVFTSNSHMPPPSFYRPPSHGPAYNQPLRHSVMRDNMRNWIYPTNYPRRDYQYNIVKAALFHNTLVSLPTGLGKTFIAAVVMFNYWRWFERGKIVFMAPTKPLVAQQKDACFNITGISQMDTAELTGAQNPASRRDVWREKRMFFITPQVLQKDIESGVCRPEDFVCLVFDEAHRASGNYAYCEVIRLVQRSNSAFRVLALSATPASDVGTLQNVITNLNIAHIEVRTEESLDLVQYIFFRQKDLFVMKPSSIITESDAKLCEAMNVYLSRLNKNRACFETNAANLSKFGLLTMRNVWRAKNASRTSSTGFIESDFAVLMSLAHARDLLIRHGVTPFLRHMQGIVYPGGEDAPAGTPKGVQGHLKKNSILMSLVTSLELKSQQPGFVGHPKLDKVESVVLKHFTDLQEREKVLTPDTRVMIFSEFRESVTDIASVLQKHEPLLRTMTFVGQSSAKNKKGFSQKEQLEVIKKFKEGGYNILVATCIGEEGLDIGEVDLIICYDIQGSPIRMLQRAGRTGRKRNGRIVNLVAEGREEGQMKKTEAAYKRVQKALATGKFQYYTDDRRMIPADIHPIPEEQCMVIPEAIEPSKASSARKTSTSTGDFLWTESEWKIYSTLYKMAGPPPRKLKLNSHRTLQSIRHDSSTGHSSAKNLYISSLCAFDRIQKEDIGLHHWLHLLEQRRKKFVGKDSESDSDDTLPEPDAAWRKTGNDPDTPHMNAKHDAVDGTSTPIMNSRPVSDSFSNLPATIEPLAANDFRGLIMTESPMTDILEPSSTFEKISLEFQKQCLSARLDAVMMFARQFDAMPDLVAEFRPVAELGVQPVVPDIVKIGDEYDFEDDFPEMDLDNFIESYAVEPQNAAEPPKMDLISRPAAIPIKCNDPIIIDDDDDDDFWNAAAAVEIPSRKTTPRVVKTGKIQTSPVTRTPVPAGSKMTTAIKTPSAIKFKIPSDDSDDFQDPANVSAKKSIQFEHSPSRILSHKHALSKQPKMTKSVFIDNEACVDSDDDCSDDERSSMFSSSLDGFVKHSATTDPSSTAESSMIEPVYQAQGMYKLKMEVPLSQKIRGGVKYHWNSNGADDSTEQTQNSFVVGDDEVEYATTSEVSMHDSKIFTDDDEEDDVKSIKPAKKRRLVRNEII
eukprot:Partr_v1_DN28447_c1_g1_i4_m41771 putative Fanconi anemia, complementation group M